MIARKYFSNFDSLKSTETRSTERRRVEVREISAISTR